MNFKDMFSLKNKVAVVIGGCGLIGKEVVNGLSDFEAMVYIADVDKANTQRVAVKKNIKYVYLDIKSEPCIQKALNEVKKASGRIDILVNCAFPRTGDWGLKVEQVPYASWQENLDSHLGGYFLVSRRAAEMMKKEKRGVIINFASIYGVVAPDFSIYSGTKMTLAAAYPAIKCGIIGLTKYIATYYAKYNIRANTISPGGVYDQQDPVFMKKYISKTPLGRMAAPRDMVGAVIYLSSEASSYVTGHNLLVDGGWVCW